MQGVFDECKQSILRTSTACLTTRVYKEECLKLGRHVLKMALLVSEVEFQLHIDENLRGKVFGRWASLPPASKVLEFRHHPLPLLHSSLILCVTIYLQL